MTKNELPRISVITPSYNQGDFIEDTICSVLEQGYPNLEYIIIDGGSTDQSVEVIRKYSRYLSYWVSERDRGQTDAINRGFRIANGDILAYLNSDDFYLPNALNYIAQAYLAHPSAGLYMGTGISVDAKKGNPKRYSKSVGFDYEALLKGSCYVLQPATFINRIAYEKVGELDETLKYGMDLEYWLRISREFPVVVMDEPIAAYRMYAEIKTLSGGFERWVELWHIYRRYTNLQITPGLLVEFFSILRHPMIIDQLGIDIRELAEKGFQQTYVLMQTALGLDDCIPTGKGIWFIPKKDDKLQNRDQKSSESEIKRSASVVRSRSTSDSKPRIDIVLQATGVHAWGVGGGWGNAARSLGMLHRIFSPKANWGDLEPVYDDGLFDYLANPQADLILLLGFDWHSQMLHLSPKWRDRWKNTKLLKILYVQESIEHSVRLSGNEDMKRSFLSALDCVDAIVYTDVTDKNFMEAIGKPIFWQPFGVDATVFSNRIPFRERIARPFFRGKSAAFAGQSQTYQQRREFIQHLLEQDLLDWLEYRDQPVSPHDIAEDFNRYQIAVNFPSVFSNHPSRVTEALACGCALVTNSTGVPEVDALFEDRKHLCYYQDKQGLTESIRALISNVDYAERIALDGFHHCMEHFTLDKHLSQIVTWVDSTEFGCLSREKSIAPKKLEARYKGDKRRKILIDGVIFYLQKKRPLGIYRVWKSLLNELGKTALANEILLLDRASTAPEIAGIQKRLIDGYDHIHFEDDSLYLQRICDEEDADLLISTYYTYAENTHTVIMLHDMIPEITGQDLELPEWRAKAKAIEKACAYFAVSQSTLNDFRNLYPQCGTKPIYLTPNAVSGEFRCHTLIEIANFKQKYHIHNPYFILVGHRASYKNALLFFRALSLLENKADYAVVCTGGAAELEKIFLPYLKGVEHHLFLLSDEELSTALSGAIALVYPSRYEGFGLPILEAMASGCPVITCRNSSLPEVANEAAIYVGETDVMAMRDALLAVQGEPLRSELIRKGLENVKRFSWSNTAKVLMHSIKEILARIKNIPLNPSDPCYTAPRLIRYLLRANKHERLLQCMLTLYKMYNGALRYDHRLIEESERVIAQMSDEAFHLIQEAISLSEDCDDFLFYWYGLSLARRGLPMDAYHAYINALKRHNWIAGYKWRLADLAADIAIQLGMLSQAEQLLSLVVSEHPTYHSAKQRLAQVQARSGANVPLSKGDVGSWKIPTAEELVQTSGNGSSNPNPDFRKPDSPLISAIVSTYNAAKFLPECLDDLEAQSVAHIMEIIVVNSGSQQDEERIVKRYQSRYSNIVYIHTPNRESVYAAWNRAIQVARGKYLTNANVDDRHRHNAFEIMMKVLEQNPDVDVVYADCAVTYKENSSLNKGPIYGRFRWPEFDRNLLFQSCFIGPQPMWRKSLHDKYGLFDAQFESAGDYEFWLRISDQANFLHLPEVLGLYLLSPSSIERRDVKVSIEEAERARARYWRDADGERPPVGRCYLELYTKPEEKNNTDKLYPLVSVIIPTYNRPSQLHRAIESVLHQTYPNIEIIVVNDGGKDVYPILKKVNSVRPVRYEVHEHNMGAGAARNTGLRVAQGKYIAFLDDDDIYHPEHIFALVSELEANPSFVGAYTDAIQITQVHSKKGNLQVERKVVYSVDFSSDELMVRNYIPMLCLMIRKEALAVAGYFDESLPALEDWEWLIRVSRVGRFSHLPFVTAEYLVRHGSKSRNMLSQADIMSIYQKIYRNCAPYSSPKIRVAQRDYYRLMTGRDLWSDLPELSEGYQPEHQENKVHEKSSGDSNISSLARKKAVKTLQSILDAEDISSAVEAHRNDLNNELLELIIENAKAARSDGYTDLADGLESLYEYIQDLMRVPNSP